MNCILSVFGSTLEHQFWDFKFNNREKHFATVLEKPGKDDLLLITTQQLCDMGNRVEKKVF
jgi:hypothetical protein